MAGGNPYLQDVTPDGAPDPVTPAASDPTRPPAPVDFSGDAPYDIAAPQNIGGISAAFNAANSLGTIGTGDGVLYGEGPRGRETEAFLDSPAGIGAMSITSGFPDYENSDITPPAGYETPIQGSGYHPGTMQDGLQTYMDGESGLQGVPPESGSMSGGTGDYPGTLQSGLPTYGGK